MFPTLARAIVPTEEETRALVRVGEGRISLEPLKEWFLNH